MIHLNFSSNLSLGGPPVSKSDEKSKCIILFIEISRCEDLFTAEQVLHLFGALPQLWQQSVEVLKCAQERTQARPAWANVMHEVQIKQMEHDIKSIVDHLKLPVRGRTTSLFGLRPSRRTARPCRC